MYEVRKVLVELQQRTGWSWWLNSTATCRHTSASLTLAEEKVSYQFPVTQPSMISIYVICCVMCHSRQSCIPLVYQYLDLPQPCLFQMQSDMWGPS